MLHLSPSVHVHKFGYIHMLYSPIEVVKMAVSVLIVTVLLLSVSEVISKCPPSSGKTLDVYNNNCIGFYRYLPDA